MVLKVAHFCNLQKIILTITCIIALNAHFRIFIPADLLLIVHFWQRFLGLTIYTSPSGKGLKASSLQLVPTNVIVVHSKNRLCCGLLEKLNSLYLLIFFYPEIRPARIDEEIIFLYFFLLIFSLCSGVK